MKLVTVTILGVLCLTSTVVAQIKTVPWNGYKGAVSFTFDDGCSSQLTNVIPALKTRNIHATFFLPGNTFSSSKASWIQVARDGNEIANHTYSHPNLTTVSSKDSIVREVVKQANDFRSADTSIECVTLAYPNCATNDQIDAITNQEHIIARTCGGDAHFAWNTQPSNWMRMTSGIISDPASAAQALIDIDNAAKGKSWYVSLNHGVGGDWLSVDTKNVTDMFDRALKDSLWIETYQTVAAYWRASFTMDTVKPVSTSDGWSLSWKSPHPKMPEHVLLKIQPSTSTFGSTFYVYQNNKEIPRQSDGSYIIDFMVKELIIAKGQVSVSKFHTMLHKSTLRPQIAGQHLILDNLGSGVYTCSMYSISGKLLSRNQFTYSSDKNCMHIDLADQTSGTFIIQLEELNKPSTAVSWKVSLEKKAK